MQPVELIIIYPDINWALEFAFLSVWVIDVPGIAPGRRVDGSSMLLAPPSYRSFAEQM